MTNTNDKMREQFEKWAYPKHMKGVSCGENKGYYPPEANLLWEVWQAAYNRTQPPIVDREKELIDMLDEVGFHLTAYAESQDDEAQDVLKRVSIMVKNYKALHSQPAEPEIGAGGYPVISDEAIKKQFIQQITELVGEQPAETSELVRALIKAREFTQHHEGCYQLTKGGGRCDCSFSEFLQEYKQALSNASGGQNENR